MFQSDATLIIVETRYNPIVPALVISRCETRPLERQRQLQPVSSRQPQRTLHRNLNFFLRNTLSTKRLAIHERLASDSSEEIAERCDK